MDIEGRYVFLHCRLFTVECMIAVLYIPPPFSLVVLWELMAFTIIKSDIPLYIMRDFNRVLIPVLDTPPGIPGLHGQGHQSIQVPFRICMGRYLETKKLAFLLFFENVHLLDPV